MVFSKGVIFLTVTASGGLAPSLYFVITDRLIPLFAIGAEPHLRRSDQLGMVVHSRSGIAVEVERVPASRFNGLRGAISTIRCVMWT